MRGPLRSVLAGAALAPLLVVVAAAPAAAHGGGASGPTNFETRVLEVVPPVDGLDVRVVDLSGRLELRNGSGTDVTVLGYDGEPYLRAGPDGAFRNTRSPAVFWNRSRTPSGELPESYDAGAAPVWERTGAEPVVRWHDHRAHWMGTREPRGARRVVGTWTVGLLAGDGPVEVRGDLVWIPGPSPVPPLALGASLAIAVALAARSGRWRAVLLAALVLLTAAVAVHATGEWAAAAEPAGARLASEAAPLAGVVLGALAAFRLARRPDAYDATPAVLLAGVVLAVAGGVAGIPALGRSRLPTVLPAPLDRMLVGAALGLGAAVVGAAAARLRRPAPAAAVPAVHEAAAT